MADTRIQGSVKRIGRRITEIGDNIRIEDIHEINVQPSQSEQSELDSDPSKYYERFLRQEGQKVQRVVIPKGARVAANPRGWMHISVDLGDRGMECVWVFIEDPPAPKPDPN